MDIFNLSTFYYIVTFAIPFTITILGIILLGLHIAPEQALNNLRLARNYLSLSYFILGILGFVDFFLNQTSESNSLSAFCILIIASYQALLFTYTILALIQPLYVKQKHIFIQLGTITVVGILLLIAMFFATNSFYTIFFYIVAGVYIFQISYYTYIFRIKYYACLQSLEEYYEDDERIRLQWANSCFYSALTIGVLALASLFLGSYFYILFSILYTLYYAYIVSRLYNYQIDFKFAMPVINQNYANENSKNEVEIQSENYFLIEKQELFKCALDKWVEQRKFTQKDISVDEIAKSLGVDRNFLQYYFRTYMHADFRTWRSELRICEAQVLLKSNPEMSLEQIREQMGFNHRANFHQQFQKITGMTPSEYKQRQTSV